MKQVSIEKWKQANDNLQAKRKQGTPSRSSKAIDYKELLAQCYIGKTVLDVGCGTQHLKQCLPEGTEYYSLDPFPVEGYPVDFAMPIEELSMEVFDTVVCMAALDNVADLQKALESIRDAATDNCILLTGIGIEPDQYHTVRVDWSDFEAVFRFPDWGMHQAYEVLPNVWLIEYIRR